MEVGDSVQLQLSHRNWCSGVIKEKSDKPRSFIVDTENGKTLRRNSSHLRKSVVASPVPNSSVPEKSSTESNTEKNTDANAAQSNVTNIKQTDAANGKTLSANPAASNQVVTRYGRVIKPVQRLQL